MINQAIYNWIDFVVGVAVKEAPYGGARIDDDYITYQVMSIEPEQHAYKHKFTQSVGNLYDWTKCASAALRVSLNAYSPDGMAMLNRLAMSGDWWEARQQLISDGDELALLSAGAPTNLTGLGDEGYRSRYQADFNFIVSLADQRTIYSITQWHLTGQFSNTRETVQSQVDLTVDQA